jgi:hypothetical protein
MANELKHVQPTPDDTLTRAEFEHINLHQFDSQAAGDLPYASSTTLLSRLAIGSANAFLTSTGSAPAWTTAPTVADDALLKIGTTADTVILNRSTALSADAELSNVIEGTSDHLGVAANSLIISNITNDGDIMFAVSDAGNSKGLLKLDGANGRVVVHGGDVLLSGAQKIYFNDIGGEYMSSDGSTLAIVGNATLAGNFLPSADDTYDLGSSAAAWQDAYLEGDLHLTDAGSVQTDAGDLTIDAAGDVVIKSYERYIPIEVTAAGTNISTGDGKKYFQIPAGLNGGNITSITAFVTTAPVGSTIIIQLHNLTDTADVLSTRLTFDAGELVTSSAAAAAVINTGADDVATGDIFRIDIDQVGSSTAGAGLHVTVGITIP